MFCLYVCFWQRAKKKKQKTREHMQQNLKTSLKDSTVLVFWGDLGAQVTHTTYNTYNFQNKTAARPCGRPSHNNNNKT